MQGKHNSDSSRPKRAAATAAAGNWKAALEIVKDGTATVVPHQPKSKRAKTAKKSAAKQDGDNKDQSAKSVSKQRKEAKSLQIDSLPSLPAQPAWSPPTQWNFNDLTAMYCSPPQPSWNR
ncbi:hypothetical protein JCM5353_005577 [Sporobolomyces roseus]